MTEQWRVVASNYLMDVKDLIFFLARIAMLRQNGSLPKQTKKKPKKKKKKKKKKRKRCPSCACQVNTVYNTW